MDDYCREEVHGLHKFFTDWFTGSVENSRENFQRLPQVLTADFEIIFPDGRLFSRAEIISFIDNTYGRYRELSFQIRIERYQGRALTENLHLVTYEEWQQKGEKEEGKLTTAIFCKKADTPCGVQWLHVHEVWLPG